jgi:nucleotide-binding universal stress UspA family protein
MFKRILLPLDLTERHKRAIEIAVEMATQGGELTLLHIIEVIPGLALDEEKNFYDRLHKIADAHLARLGRTLGDRNVRWRAETVFGNRAGEIARQAAKEKSDLIILTAPRFDPENPGAGWSSLSWKTAIVAQCPILLVK